MARYSISTHTRRLMLSFALIGLATGLITSIQYLSSIIPSDSLSFTIGYTTNVTINSTIINNPGIGVYQLTPYVINVTSKHIIQYPAETYTRFITYIIGNTNVTFRRESSYYDEYLIIYVNGSIVYNESAPSSPFYTKLIDRIDHTDILVNNNVVYSVDDTNITTVYIVDDIETPTEYILYYYKVETKSPAVVDLSIIVKLIPVMFSILLLYKAARLMGIGI